MKDSDRTVWPQKPILDLDHSHSEYAKARTVVIPAPYDKTVTYGRGTARGPRAILEASWNVELYDVIVERELHVKGIHCLEPLALPEDPAQAVKEVKAAVERELDNDKYPVLLGGEHSLTAGAVAAAKQRYHDLSVLQLDAHADLRDTYKGTPHSHACVMRRIADLKVPFVSAGIRSMSREEAEWIRKNKAKIYYAHRMLNNTDWIPEVISSLSEQVYLSLDIDVLDPSEMPSTGTPEPGGLYYYDIVELLLALKESSKKVVAADLMEFAPIQGLHAPDFLAAKLLYLMAGF